MGETMERKHWGVFSGTHLTIMFAATMAVIASTGLYAAATSVVSIGNTTGNATAVVTGSHQLQTALTAPNNVVHAVATVSSGCLTVYTPPAGKAIVVTQVTYNL